VSDNVKSKAKSKEFRLFLLLLQAILNQSILHQLPLERMAHSNQFKFGGDHHNSPVVKWYSYLCVPKEDEKVAQETGAYRGRPGKKKN